MKLKVISFLLVITSSTLILSCTFCGVEETYKFHQPIEIYFENENSDVSISPTGAFIISKSALYDEEGVLIDTSFAHLSLNDWKENWNEDNVKYSRAYEMVLVHVSNGKDYTYDLDINYWGEINNCNSYEINRIQLFVNDSLQIDNDFFTSVHTLFLPE